MTVVANPISIHRYIGLSTDTKPTIAAPLGMAPPTISSTFLEYDTGLLFITYDGTTWVIKDYGSSLVPGKVKTLSVTKAIAAAGDYDAEDVISEHASSGTVWTFAAIFRENGTGGYITKIAISWETSNLAPNLTLYVYNAAPGCNLNDRVANTGVLNADIAKHIATIHASSLSDNGGNSEAIVTPNTPGGLPVWVDANASADDLLIVAVTDDAITGEAAGEDLTIKVSLEQY